MTSSERSREKTAKRLKKSLNMLRENPKTIEQRRVEQYKKVI